MTSNQISNKRAEEEARSNRERERETNRSNLVKEKETARSNRANEMLTRTGQNKKLVGDVVGGIAKGIFQSANDVSWYNLDPKLLEDVASFSYFTPLGQKVDKDFSHINTLTGPEKRTVAGIMAIKWVPTIGDYLTMRAVAQNIYAWTRHMNSGHTNYDPEDEFMYLLASDSFYSAFATLCRLYSVVNTYKASNKYYAKGMVKALGFDFDDVVQNIPQLRAYINNVHNRINSIRVPKIFSYSTRHMWMNTNIFKDSNIVRSQEYVFVQDLYFKFTVDLNTGSRLTPVRPVQYGQTCTFARFKAMVDEMIEAFLSNEDCGIISGDILKAYGESGLVVVGQVTDDYHIESIYSPEVLSQIDGACLHNFVNDDNSKYFTVWQDAKGNIFQGDPNAPAGMDKDKIYIPVNNYQNSTTDMATDQAYNKGRATINLYKDDVTPGDTMVATRLATTWSLANVKTGDGPAAKYSLYYLITSVGSEICTYATVYSMNTDVGGDTFIATDYYGMFYDISSMTLTEFLKVSEKLSIISQFDWHPTINMAYKGSAAISVKEAGILKDTCNYAVLNSSELKRLHEVAIISEFGLPYTGLKAR